MEKNSKVPSWSRFNFARLVSRWDDPSSAAMNTWAAFIIMLCIIPSSSEDDEYHVDEEDEEMEEMEEGEVMIIF